jgi:hypothetical protein
MTTGPSFVGKMPERRIEGPLEPRHPVGSSAGNPNHGIKVQPARSRLECSAHRTASKIMIGDGPSLVIVTRTALFPDHLNESMTSRSYFLLCATWKAVARFGSS